MTDTGYATRVTAQAIRALIIRPDNSFETLSLEQPLEARRELVGGHVAPIVTDDATFWINEDGKMIDLPFNAMATYLWWKIYPAAEALDVFCGCVIVTGNMDKQGNMTHVPSNVLELYGRMEDFRKAEDETRG